MNKNMWIKLAVIVLLPGLLMMPPAAKAETPRPDVEMFASAGFYHWIEKSPYVKKIAETAFWEDVRLSGQWVGILGLGNRLEEQLGMPVSALIIREILSAPMEAALWNAFGKEERTLFVVTLDLKPQLKSLVKLVETYAGATQRSTVIKRNNLDILETQWGGHTFYHLVRRNQLVFSNHLDYLLSLKPFRDSGFFREYHKGRGGNLKFRVNLAAWLKNFKEALARKEMNLAVNMDLGESVRFHSFSLIAEPGFKAEELNSLESCGPMIPRRAMLAVSGVYPAAYYLGKIKELPGFQDLNNELQLDTDKDVAPFLNERFFFYVRDLQEQDTANILNGAAGFSLNAAAPEQRRKIEDFVRLVMTRKGQTMQPQELTGGLKVYRYKDPLQPAFCITDGWLLVGAGYDQLRESLAVLAKKRSSITDSLGYRELEKRFAVNAYWHIFFNSPRFFKSAANHLLYRGKSSNLYNAADVKHKLLPVLDILADIPAFGIFIGIDNNVLKGEVKFIE
jgi:hypothetical protein